MILAHFVDQEKTAVICKKEIHSIPRKGDILWFVREGKYYRVISVTYVYDEQVERVIIRCTKIFDSQQFPEFN